MKGVERNTNFPGALGWGPARVPGTPFLAGLSDASCSDFDSRGSRGCSAVHAGAGDPSQETGAERWGLSQDPKRRCEGEGGQRGSHRFPAGEARPNPDHLGKEIRRERYSPREVRVSHRLGAISPPQQRPRAGWPPASPPPGLWLEQAWRRAGTPGMREAGGGAGGGMGRGLREGAQRVGYTPGRPRWQS